MTTPAPRRRLPSELAGIGLLAAVIALALGLGLVVDHYPFGFDRAIILGLRSWGGPSWLPRFLADVTALGGGDVLTLIVVIAAGALLVKRLWLTALALVAASLSGAWLIELVKNHVVRARPDIVEHLVSAKGYSFPSGHATASAIVYLTLAALVGQVTPDRALRRYGLIVAVLLVGLIGTSRVYLGVHWPSDVLAGWSLGTLWALGWWLATAKARAAIGGER
ncbi:undecaprenyl-diphosphatase [Sphingomonas jinjuensis]|uniref:Undecaprenyl-diphosphatase n=1 Tax=Sphingomonas jinjuensis TaxID=535907 RepID=A0A840F493_9SPHN|nr:phosphatase PAP2 family protein [Sphingomonas jinjuensis]MBB4152619.1 undecaprenyl-diphosphatase [Sphingomonas jinjuensis]